MPTVNIRFHGERGGIGTATWSQREKFASLAANAPYDARFNVRALWGVDPGYSLEQVQDALTRLIERHETLRTCYVRNDSGPPSQRLLQDGGLSVQRVDTDPISAKPVALETLDEIAREPIDPAAEPPLRMSVVMADGEPRWIVAALCYLMVDEAGLDIAERDLHRILQGQTLSPPRLQPLDRAHFEQSAAGQSTLQRSLRSWRKGLATGRVPLFPIRPDHGDEQSFPSAVMYGHGAAQRARTVAESLGVGTSGVCTAAAAAALGRAAALETFPLIITCSNRITPETTEYVGSIAQQGLLTVDATLPFPELVRSIWIGLLGTYRNSTFDPWALDPIIREASGDSCTTIFHYLNFRDVPEIEMPEHIQKIAARGSFVRPDSPVDSTVLEFGFGIRCDGSDLLARVFGDGRRLSSDRMVSILEDMEKTLLVG